MIRRGDIYYIQPQESVGSEQWSGRPAVVVSNDKNNEYSATVEIVYLTTQPKNELETHAITKATGLSSTALCEQITSVDKSRLGNWKGRCSDEEMEQIDRALKISLDLSDSAKHQASEHVLTCLHEGSTANDTAEKAKLEAERDVYKKMYEDMAAKLVSLAKWQKDAITAPSTYPYATWTTADCQASDSTITSLAG